jgi:hypothetical protein
MTIRICTTLIHALLVALAVSSAVFAIGHRSCYAQPIPPPVPRIEDATRVTAESFIARWSIPDTTKGVVLFLIDVALDVDFKYILPGYNARTSFTTNFPVEGLESNTVYYYRVKAVRFQEREGSVYSYLGRC